VTDLVDVRLHRMKDELSRLARDYCQAASIASFVLPVGTDGLKIAYGTPEQIKHLLDGSRMTPYLGSD
jgi:hypothetical protein